MYDMEEVGNIKKYRVEFHVHTVHSKDSMLNKFFILLMCKIKKIKCIAITDHNEIKGAVKYEKFLKKHNVNVIIGEEIFTSEGEIIGLFLMNKIEKNLSPEETILQIRKQGGLVYIPHPYDEKRKETVLKSEALKRIYKDVDFIECHNGRNISTMFSIKQNEIAEKYGLTKIIGSDAHTFYEIGRNYCYINSFNKEDLINEIKNAEFYKKKCIKVAHFHTKIAKIIKMMGNGEFSELRRIINKKIRRRK